MPRRSEADELRPLPAAVYVPEKTMQVIARRVAQTPEITRKNEKIVLVKAGKYKARTDQVVTYNHESNLPRQYPKADLISAQVCSVSKIPESVRSIMKAPIDNKAFLRSLREFWDESLEMDSPVTILVCENVKGPLIDYYAKSFAFNESLGRGKE